MRDLNSYDGRLIMLTKKKQKMPYTRMLALGFALIILMGALLLCLPVSTRSREWMPFLDALFTATSATCVTGLVVADTYQNWSLFGQLVILTLIQIRRPGLHHYRQLYRGPFEKENRAEGKGGHP